MLEFYKVKPQQRFGACCMVVYVPSLQVKGCLASTSVWMVPGTADEEA